MNHNHHQQTITRRDVSACTASVRFLSTQTLATPQMILQDPLQIVDCNGKTICYLIPREDGATLDFYGVMGCSGIAFDATESTVCRNNALWVNAIDNDLYFGSTNLSDRQTGPPGADGRPGLPGAPGPMGDTGRTGDTGLCGDTGNSGPDGPLGYVGRNGENGLAGQDGNPGPDGPMGAMGAAGSNGFLLEQPLVFVSGQYDSIAVTGEYKLIDENTTDLLNKTLIDFVVGQTIRIDLSLCIDTVTGSHQPVSVQLEIGGKRMPVLGFSAHNSMVLEFSLVTSTAWHATDPTQVILRFVGVGKYFYEQNIGYRTLGNYQQFPGTDVPVSVSQLDFASLLRVFVTSQQPVTINQYPTQVYVYVPNSRYFLFNWRSGGDLIDETSINATNGLALGTLILQQGHSMRLEYDGFVNLNTNNTMFVATFSVELYSVPLATFQISLDRITPVHFSVTITRIAQGQLKVSVNGFYQQNTGYQIITYGPVSVSHPIAPSNLQLGCVFSPSGPFIQTHSCFLYDSW